MAGVDGSIHTDMLFWTTSGEVILMTVLGGINQFFGPFVGAAVIILIEDLVGARTEYWSLIFGAIIMVIVLVFPKGLVGEAARFRSLLTRTVEEGSMTPILQLDAVDKAFGGLRVTSKVSFSVMPGEISAIIGPNGAGKTTLFNQITGHLLSDAGAIYFKGENIVGRPPQQIVARGVGRAFQIASLFPDETVLDNIRVACLSKLDQTRKFWRSGWISSGPPMTPTDSDEPRARWPGPPA